MKKKSGSNSYLALYENDYGHNHFWTDAISLLCKASQLQIKTTQEYSSQIKQIAKK